MKNPFIALLICSVLLVAVSCKKDAVLAPRTVDHSKDFLNETRITRSARSSEYFIRGMFDGKFISCTSKPDVSLGYDFYNTQFVSDSGLDQINLIRFDQANTVQLALFFQQANMFKRPMPYDVPAGNGEFAELQLMNLRRLGTAVQGSEQDDYTFWANTGNGIQVKVSSVADSILIGNFEGYISSNTGSTILVRDGQFRIKIKLFKF